jgi:hypothetical protein
MSSLPIQGQKSDRSVGRQVKARSISSQPDIHDGG